MLKCQIKVKSNNKKLSLKLNMINMNDNMVKIYFPDFEYLLYKD